MVTLSAQVIGGDAAPAHVAVSVVGIVGIVAIHILAMQGAEALAAKFLLLLLSVNIYLSVAISFIYILLYSPDTPGLLATSSGLILFSIVVVIFAGWLLDKQWILVVSVPSGGLSLFFHILTASARSLFSPPLFISILTYILFATGLYGAFWFVDYRRETTISPKQIITGRIVRYRRLPDFYRVKLDSIANDHNIRISHHVFEYLELSPGSLIVIDEFEAVTGVDGNTEIKALSVRQERS